MTTQADAGGRPLRSLLFVPADSPRKLEKSLASGADALIFDLEDAVAAARKDAARQELSAFLEKHAGTPDRPAFHVRVNALRTGMTLADLAAVMPHRPAAIVLPKCGGADDLRTLAGYLDVFDHLHGVRQPTAIIAIATETAASLHGLPQYAGVTPRLLGLMWGAEDLSGDLGSLASKADGAWTAPFALARSLCLIGAAAAGVLAIDTVPTVLDDPDALLAEAREAWRDGFRAKAAIHPAQIAPIHAAMTPSDQELAWARSVEAAFADATTGVATLDGRMLDMPHLRLARRLLASAGA